MYADSYIDGEPQGVQPSNSNQSSDHERAESGDINAAAYLYADYAAEVFTLLSDATRVRIILALEAGEESVNDLAELIGKSSTVISQHLAKLRMGKIVKARQAGNRVFYSLIDEHARQLVTQAVYQAQHVIEEKPRHHQQQNPTDEVFGRAPISVMGTQKDAQ